MGALTADGKLALHEAAHSLVAARLLGLDHVGGATVHGGPWLGAAEILDMGAGEQAIMTLLAGRQAELLAAELGLELDPDADGPASAVVETPAPLSIDDIIFVRFCDSPAAPVVGVGDFERAAALADGLVGEPDALALLARLEQQTRALLLRELPALERLARALLERGTLAAVDVAALLDPNPDLEGATA